MPRHHVHRDFDEFDEFDEQPPPRTRHSLAPKFQPATTKDKAPLKPGAVKKASKALTNRQINSTAKTLKVSRRQQRLGAIPALHAAADRGDHQGVRRLLSPPEEAGDRTKMSNNNLPPNVLSQDPEDDGNTPLHVAARAGHLEVAAVLLEYGGRIEARNKYGDTCLHVAAANGQIRMLKFFFDRNLKNEMFGGRQFTALHSAAEAGQGPTCKYLILEAGFNIEAQSARGDTPLHVASQMGETGAMKTLLRLGADIEARNKMAETPFHRACAWGQSEAVRLLALRKANLEVRQKYGWTLMHTAAANGQVETVKLLLEIRGDINAQDNNSHTPLHVAAFFGRSDVVQLLLQKGCHTEMRDIHGRTALHAAAWCGMRHGNSASKMQLRPVANEFPGEDYSTMPIWYGFSRSGEAICSTWQSRANPEGTYPSPSDVTPPSNLNVADVLAKDLHNYSPVHFAATTGQSEALKFIMKNGARLDERSDGARSALHMTASGCGLYEVGSLLIDRNVPVDGRDKNGETPLLLSCRFGKVDLASLLIERGANANLPNKLSHGDTPLHRAAECGQVAIAEMLLALTIERQKVVEVDVRNSAGDTPLIKAALTGHIAVARLLLSNGAAINWQRDFENKKQTALHVACQFDHYDFVQMLLELEADVNATDAEGLTPLHYAAWGGHVQICRVLTADYKANVEATDEWGRSPIHLAAMNRQAETVEFFLTNTGAEVEWRDDAGNTVLHYACDRKALDGNDLELLRLLSDENITKTPIGKLMKLKNSVGETPYVRLKNVAVKSKDYNDLFRFISSKMTDK